MQRLGDRAHVLGTPHHRDPQGLVATLLVERADALREDAVTGVDDQLDDRFPPVGDLEVVEGREVVLLQALGELATGAEPSHHAPKPTAAAGRAMACTPSPSRSVPAASRYDRGRHLAGWPGAMPARSAMTGPQVCRCSVTS